MANFSVGTTLTNVLQPNINPINPSKQSLVFAGRTLKTNNILSLPFNGNAMPNLYVPFMLPAYTSGSSALVALQQMGFNYVLGLSFNSTFIAPDTVTTSISSGLCTMIWNDTMIGLQYLVGQSPVGTVVQGVNNGSIISVSIINNTSVLVIAPVVGSIFTNSSPITISAELNNPAPDPKNSDEVCVFAYWFYNQYNFSPLFTTSPNLWISIYLTGIDTSISPNSTAIVLVDPVTSIIQPDGSYNLTYPLTAYNLGELPTTSLGNTIVTQNSNTAIYNGYTLTSTTCIINVINPSGIFDDSHTLSIVKDITKNGFAYLGKYQINCFAMCYNIIKYTNGTNYLIDINNVSHDDFYNGIIALQSPSSATANKFNAKGYYSYVAPSVNYIPLSNLTTPNVSYFHAGAKLDIPTSLQYPCNACIITATMMFNDSNNEYPFNETSGESAVLGITASTNQVSYPDFFSMNQLCTQGFTAVGINRNGQCYIYRDVCTLQSISGLSDNEYRFMSLQQKLTWLDLNLYQTAEATCILSNGTRANNNPELISTMQSNLLTVLSVGYNKGKGIIGNTNNTVIVTLSTSDVTKLAIYVTTTIVSANSGNEIQVTITPFTI